MVRSTLLQAEKLPTEHIGLDIRIFGSGSDRFLSNPDPSDPIYYDPTRYLKFLVRIRVGDPDRFIPISYIPTKYP